MSLSGSLQVGRSGLLTAQAALQVTGHNLANAATKGYHRQSVTLTPAGSSQLHHNAFLGRGVQLQAITRQIDEALESRLRGAIGDEAFSMTRQDLLAQIEAIHNEFSDRDLSTRLQSFFNAWSQLANNPQDLSLRSLVIEEGATLGDFLQTMRGDLASMRSRVEDSARDTTRQVNSLLTQIEGLNQRISISGGGSSTGAAGLKDHRDALLADLAQYLDISTVAQDNGMTDVFVGSIPIVLNGKSRGVELRTESDGDQLRIDLVAGSEKSPLQLTGGRLAALVDFRQQDMVGAIDAIDTFTHQLIWEVNRVHSQGQGLQPFASVTGATQVLDPAAALSDPDAGLHFLPQHGSFKLHVTQKSTGQMVTSTINVDLDGIGADTSLADLVAAIDAVGNVTASITTDGRLRIAGDGNDFEVSFSEDSSGVLAALGVNTFFTGRRANDIAVNPVVIGQPRLLAAATNHVPGDNTAALAMSALRDQPIESLGGLSLRGFWNRHVEEIAIRTAQARQQAEADTIVRENLDEQQQQISGVNPDEEAINLLQYQRAYQASARFISVVDELMATLINMV
jgi:flagellar hook-associated protein 1 FlgK